MLMMSSRTPWPDERIAADLREIRDIADRNRRAEMAAER